MPVLYQNTVQRRVLVLQRDRCGGCNYCIEVCPQGFLQKSGQVNERVVWPPEAHSYPRECTECRSCLPRQEGGDQEKGRPPVLCPWRVCTMCDLCTRICPDFAIYTLPLPGPETARASGTPMAEESV